METSFLKRISLLALVIVYNFFFWGENLGINLFIFTILLFVALYFINKESFNSKSVLATAASVIILGGLVVYNNTLLSKFIFFIFLVTSLGFIHQHELRSILAAIPTGLLSFAMFPYVAILEAKNLSGRFSAGIRILKKAKLIFVPLLIFIVFYIIYLHANPIFAEASDYVWTQFDNFFVRFIFNFPFARIFFILLGVVLISGFLYNCDINFFVIKEKDFSDVLTRRYNPFNRIKYGFKTFSLVNEMKSAVILLVLINILIAVLNYIDIRYVWFGFEYYKGFDIRQFVHEGTYLLILSILLSMIIMLFYFRGNLNFYSGNKWMKGLAYFWIFQNAIMAISVGVRNFHYIYYSHILAYKRIGLIMFLIMVFIGLITLYLKIKKRRTIFHLIKVNFISVYAVLFISCFFNWGPIMAEFNLSNPDKEAIDYEFNLDLSDETLPVLDRYEKLLDREVILYKGIRKTTINGKTYFLDRRKEFMTDYESRSWLSWNYADWKTYEYLKYKELNNYNE